MKTTLKVLALVLSLSGVASAQVVPAAIGENGAPAAKRLFYAFRYGQAAMFGTGGLTASQTSNLSASADYATGSLRAPFLVDYAGGYSWTLTGPDYGSGVFQRLSVSQGGVWRKFTATVSDDVSYLPHSPLSGFSGIPGIGEPIGTPAPGSSQSIFTLNTHALEDMVNGSIEARPTASTSLRARGSYDLLRFPNNDGINTNAYTAEGGLSHRLDGRDTVTGTYQYAHYSFPGYTTTFGTQSGLIGFQRLLSRKLSATGSAGPLWIESTVTSVVPSKLTYAANATLTYAAKPVAAGLHYSHGVNGGAGYLLGATWDTVDGDFTKTIGPNVQIGFTGGYSRTGAIGNNGTANSVTGTSQAIWQITHSIIAYANYTGISQSTTSLVQGNVLNNFLNTIGFGVGFSPREAHNRQ